MIELDRLRCDLEHLREMPLEDHRSAAETDRLVPFVEERLGDDSDRVREVDDPRVGCEPPDALGDVEDDRHRSQRLGKPAEAGRLLAYAPAAQR